MRAAGVAGWSASLRGKARPRLQTIALLWVAG